MCGGGGDGRREPMTGVECAARMRAAVAAALTLAGCSSGIEGV